MPLDELKEFAKRILAENSQLKIQLMHKDFELIHKDFELQRMEKERSYFIDQLRDHKMLKKEVESLRAEMTTLKADLARLIPMEEKLTALTFVLGAREVAINFDREMALFIWSECRSKPYHIYSLKNLRKFLEDPENAYKSSICGHLAPGCFSAKPEEEQERIRERMDEVASLIDLSVLDLLKETGKSAAHPKFADPEEMIAYFKETEPEVAAAIADLVRARKVVILKKINV